MHDKYVWKNIYFPSVWYGFPLENVFWRHNRGDILNTAPPPPWAISGLMQVAVLSTISWFRAALSCSAQDCPLPPVSTPKTPRGDGGCQTTSERECECVGVEDPDWKPKAECSDRFFHPVRMDGWDVWAVWDVRDARGWAKATPGHIHRYPDAGGDYLRVLFVYSS